MKITLIVISSVIGVIFVSFMAFCAYIGIFGLDSKVCYLRELKSEHVNVIKGICKLDSDEVILMFYSTDMISPTDDGNLLTNKNVYSYTRDAGNVTVSKVKFADITNVSPVYGKSFIDDTTVTVTYGDDDEFLILILAIEAKRDVEFIKKLKDFVVKSHVTDKDSKHLPNQSLKGRM
jgi:hypothetical protein